MEVLDVYSSLMLLGRLPYGRWNGRGTWRTWRSVLWGSLCRSGYKFGDNTNMNLKGRELDIVNWLGLVHDRSQWLVIV